MSEEATRHLTAESELARPATGSRAPGATAGATTRGGRPSSRAIFAAGCHHHDRSAFQDHPELAAHSAAGGGEELIDVVVELGGASRDKSSADALREAFRQAATPVAEAINNLGGEVTGEAWINQTLRARLPAKSVGRLSDVDEVRAVAVPPG